MLSGLNHGGTRVRVLCTSDSAANRDCDKKSRRTADVGGNAGRGHYEAAAQVEDQVWMAGRVARWPSRTRGRGIGTIWLPPSRTFLGGAVRFKATGSRMRHYSPAILVR